MGIKMKIEFTGTLQEFTDALDKEYSGFSLEKDGTNTFATLNGIDIGRWSAVLGGGWIEQL